MGLFNKILKGLGFEDEDENEPKVQKVKEKKEKRKNSISASFDLENINEEKEEVKIDNVQEENANEQNSSTNFEVVKVNSQIDVQNAIKKLKNGTKILINIEGLNDSDIIRSLDFITGAVFALNLNMQKIDEKIFLIQ